MTHTPPATLPQLTVDFEYLFFFTQSPEYFFDRQYEPHHETTKQRVKRFVERRETFDPARHKMLPAWKGRSPYAVLERISRKGLNPLGRNKRCVWSIPTQPFSGSHFASLFNVTEWKFPTYIHRYSVRLGPKKDAVRAMRFVSLGTLPVIMNGRIGLRPGRN